MSRKEDLDVIQSLFPAEVLGLTPEKQRKNLEQRSDGTIAAFRQRLEAKKEEVRARNTRIAKNLRKATREMLRGLRREKGLSAKAAREAFEKWLETPDGQGWLQHFQKFIEPVPDEE